MRCFGSDGGSCRVFFVFGFVFLTAQKKKKLLRGASASYWQIRRMVGVTGSIEHTHIKQGQTQDKRRRERVFSKMENIEIFFKIYF